MLDHYFRSPHVRTRVRNSPIREHIERLVKHLHGRGHRTATIHQYVHAAEHFGRVGAGNEDRLWNEETDLVESEDFDYVCAGARLLGRDIVAMSQGDVLNFL